MAGRLWAQGSVFGALATELNGRSCCHYITLLVGHAS